MAGLVGKYIKARETTSLQFFVFEGGEGREGEGGERENCEILLPLSLMKVKSIKKKIKNK